MRAMGWGPPFPLDGTGGLITVPSSMPRAGRGRQDEPEKGYQAPAWRREGSQGRRTLAAPGRVPGGRTFRVR